MDVDGVSFPGRLLSILEALSESHFVSLDFELSGVTSKSRARQKQTIQERYAETKQAAERYQILQVGLTCVCQDESTNTYTLRPYNFPINPSFGEDLDLERIFSFQSGAVDFLRKNNFNFAIPFEDGVPYLSREEEQLAKQKFKERGNRTVFEDIQIAEDDLLSTLFLAKVRGEVCGWLNTEVEELEIVRLVRHKCHGSSNTSRM